MRLATGRHEVNYTEGHTVKTLFSPAAKRAAIWAAIWICLTAGAVSPASAEPPARRRHPKMHLTPEEMAQMRAAHLRAKSNAPLAADGNPAPGNFPASISLLPLLPYVPAERDQGECGDCWAWAGTGALEIAHNVQSGVSNRLSVQLLNSCNPYVSCCGGGWLDNMAQFYTYEGFAVPWSNSHGDWTSGNGACGTACGTIGTSPNYSISSISAATISTWDVSQAQAITNIKAALNQNKAVWFGFFMGSTTDWDNFDDFWESQPESAQWTNFNPGEAYTSGAGHAMLCVGYDDNDPAGPAWIMVNSWGTTSGRPDGTMEVSQNINYSGTYVYDSVPYQQLYFETLNVQFATQSSNTLTINLNGTGTVLMNGTNAPATVSLPYGQVVNLTAQGNFLAWSGSQSGGSTNLQLTMTGNMAVTANFQDGTIPLAPFVVAQPVAQTLPIGGNLSLSVTGYGIPGPTFSWFAGGQPVGDGTSTLTITNMALTNQGSYYCILSNIVGVAQSASVQVNVEGAPAFVQQPSSLVVAAGSTATFVSVANSTNVAYQWYKAGAALPGCTQASLVLSDAQPASAGNYSVVITNAAIAQSATSAVATLTVLTRPSITVQPVSTNVVIGSSATLSVTASGGNLSYLWKMGSSVQSSTSNSCAINTSIAGTANYTVTVSNLAGTVTSSAAAVCVIGPPGMAAMPAAKSLGAGSNWTISAVCTNVGGTYSWFFNGTNALASNTNQYTISNAALNNSGVYSLVLSNIVGVLTNSVTVTVLNLPSIMTQPVPSNVVPVGTNVVLSVEAGGSSVLFQWSKNFKPITGATNATLSLANLAVSNSGSYTVLVTNAVGAATSQSSVLDVIPAPSFTGATANKNLDAGSNWTIVMPCSNVGGTYSWFFDGTNILASTTNSYAITNATTNESGTYTLVLSNMAGMATNAVTVAVFIYPDITGQPAAANVLPVGSNVSLTVESYGSALQYQWLKNSRPITGATNATLSFPNLAVTNTASYTVQVANKVGTVTSHASALTVIPPPSINTKPKTQTLVVNQPLTLSVAATGTKPYTNLTYQWQFGTNIPNATNATYSIPYVSTNWAGTFTVLVTNFGGATNASAVITVVPDTTPPKLTVNTPSKPVTNSPYTLTGTAKDIVAITNVAFSLDGGANFTNATSSNSWTNWSASLPLVLNTNTVTVVVTDINGLATTNTERIKYAPYFAAVLTTNGDGAGAITGFDSQMQYGVSYTLTAKPAAKNIFQFWSGLSGLSTTSATNGSKLTFTVTNTVTVTASFATNHFYAQAGTFNGLFFQTNGPTHDSSGSVKITVSTNLSYSGKVLFDGQVLSVAGQFDTNGTATLALTTNATMAFTITNQQLVGTVSSLDWTSPLMADLALFGPSNPNTDFAGNFDIIIPPDTNGTATNGYGYGSVSVSSNGIVTLVGATADGAALSQSVSLSQDGVWPLFIQLYTVNETTTAGEIFGWISFPTNGAPAGNLMWIKTSYPNTGPYVNGLTNNSSIMSSPYTAPTISSPNVLNGLTTGEAIFTGGNLTNAITSQLYATNSSIVFSNETISMKFTSGGLFTGKFIDNGTGKTGTFSGAALQNTTNAYGFFTGINQSGSFTLAPAE